MTPTTVQHVFTPADVEQVKLMAKQRAAQHGLPEPLVFAVRLCEDKVQFICQWLDTPTWQEIVNNPDYQKKSQDPGKEAREEADNFLRMKVFRQCVLWPPTFNPMASERNQPYPAGVIGTLLDKIMFSSGFTQDAAPDKVLLAPPEPREPTEEEIEGIMRAHPLASRFGLAFEKPFFVRDFNPQTGDYDFVVTRYYVYTAVDRETHGAMHTKADETAGLDSVLDACVLWPVPQGIDKEPEKYAALLAFIKDRDIPRVTWAKEPANYGDWLVNSIFAQSGFGVDPTTGVEVL